MAVSRVELPGLENKFPDPPGRNRQSRQYLGGPDVGHQVKVRSYYLSANILRSTYAGSMWAFSSKNEFERIQ